MSLTSDGAGLNILSWRPFTAARHAPLQGYDVGAVQAGRGAATQTPSDVSEGKVVNIFV